MLTEAELHELESTLLPALERHHLRLLAHSLRTLQAISGHRGGAAPQPETIARWAAGQPELAEDPLFRDAFVRQLGKAVAQLQAIAAPRQPLDLELSDLVAWARHEADLRVRAAEPAANHPSPTDLTEPTEPAASPPPG